MTLEPRHSPVLPSYGAATLADLSSSVLASVDPESPDSQNVMGLAAAERACLLIVDGLGWELLRDHPAAAPFLSELARNSKPITAGFPSTTVTSLGSICTGLPPGQHGLLGYQVMIPGENRLLNGLRWDSRVDPLEWQPLPTLYERAAQAGVAEQLAWVLRPATSIEIDGGSGGREALHARPDRHRDHVLLQPLVVADAGVAPGRQHIDEAVLGDHLELDIGIGGEEGRNDRGQHQPRGADGDVEP